MNNKLPIFGEKPQEPERPHVAQEKFLGNAAIVTLGCAKNTVDSEVMLGALANRGFRTVSDPENAELLVVNTCAFLESAVEEGVDTILSLAELKKTGRLKQLLVAGCMVERYRKDLEESLPEVDRFVSTDELLSVGSEESTTEQCFNEARRPYFLYDETMPRVLSTGSHSVYLKISEGCDRPCSFCIIPKIRGGFRSRPVQSIVSEAEGLVSQGAKELNLIAQDLTAYGDDRDDGANLLALLRQMDGIESDNDFWIRLFYAYPIGVSREFIEGILSLNRVADYLDMPLQHIAGPVLKSMRRPLGGRRTQELIENIRHWAPELKLRTTFIVGFPGETEDDVNQLVDFVSQGHFAHVGVFAYSQEKEADSFTYPNQIDPELAEERRARVMLAQQTVVEKHLASYLGKEFEVLVEGSHSESDLLMTGRASWQGPEVDGEVIINQVDERWLDESGQLDHGKIKGLFTQVKISEVAGYDLVGELK